MDKENVKHFFEKNAMSWLLNAYRDDGYNYPVAYHRARIIQKVLAPLEGKGKVVDLGCGGGNVSLMLAELGYSVVGIDQSEKMIKIAEESISEATPEAQKRLRFVNESLTEHGLDEGGFDVCIAMGLIGYLPDDEILFSTANQLLKPGGLFLVSCRNRLFNMVSISFRTVNEIKKGEAIKLIEELDELYEQVPSKVVDEMIHKLKSIVEELPDRTTYDSDKMGAPSEKNVDNPSYKPFYEPRQHTPKRLNEVAGRFGFENKTYYGVHPHLIDPRLNKLMPPQIFNKISDCLEALEHLPVSLAWSSVFIGVFQIRLSLIKANKI